jgi:hypothetical protein
VGFRAASIAAPSRKASFVAYMMISVRQQKRDRLCSPPLRVLLISFIPTSREFVTAVMCVVIKVRAALGRPERTFITLIRRRTGYASILPSAGCQRE